MSEKTRIKEQYYHAIELFGIGTNLWCMCHEHYYPAMFCRENRRDIIAEYLVLEDLVHDMKENNVIYYQGIDMFLDEYRAAVYRCLTTDVL